MEEIYVPDIYPFIVLAICLVLAGLVIGALCGADDWRSKEPE